MLLIRQVVLGINRIGPPRFESFMSQFPNSTLVVRLSLPANANGEIFEYVFKLCRSDGVGECFCWMEYFTYYGIPCPWRNIIKFYPPIADKNDIRISITNSTFVLPYTEYKLTVIGINGAGLNKRLQANFTTTQYIPGSPKLVEVLSKFPNSTLVIRLSPPVNANGRISQYIISLQRSDREGNCFFWIYDCESCRLNQVFSKKDGIQTGCKFGQRLLIRNADMNNINVQITDNSFVIPFRNYSLKAQANNGWGWGELLNTSFMTTQYKSGPPKIESISSSFINGTIKINFIFPSNPNGQISNYHVFMISLTRNLFVFWNVTCIDCGNKKVGNNGVKISTTGCNTVRKLKGVFTSNDTNTNVECDIKYIEGAFNILIQPGNTWGWGDCSKISYTLDKHGFSIRWIKNKSNTSSAILITSSIFIIIIVIIIVIFCFNRKDVAVNELRIIPNQNEYDNTFELRNEPINYVTNEPQNELDDEDIYDVPEIPGYAYETVD